MNTPLEATYITSQDEVTESWLIHDIARLMKKRFDRRARTLGLTRAQWMALATLRRHPGINQVELADKLDVEPMTVARLIDRLEEAGWVERRADTKDRRAKLLFLTARTEEITTQIRALALQTRREALQGVSQEEHRALLNALQKIKGNLCQSKAGVPCVG